MLNAPKIDALKRKPSFNLNEEKWRAPRKRWWKTGPRAYGFTVIFPISSNKREKIDVKNADWNSVGCVREIAWSECLFVCVVHPFIYSIFQRLAISMPNNEYKVYPLGDFVKKIISTTGFRLMAKPLPLPFFTRSLMVRSRALCSAHKR